jgi:hypothetical protein
MANDAALIFRIKGDASHVKKELSSLGVSASRTVGTLAQGVTGALNRDFSALSGGLSSLAGGLSSMGPLGLAAGGALAAIGTAAVTAAGSIFALTKQAAEYAGTIMDAMEMTGLGAETLTALDYAAKISGSSIEEVTKATIKFSRTIGEAAKGSKEAQDRLASLGINPQEALNDLDGALSKVFRRIMSLPPSVQRSTAAYEAFGKAGAKLLPMINTLDGDLEGFIEKAREVGVVMDDQTVIALDAFDENLQRIQAQLGGLTRQIGIAFLPVLSEMATEFESFVKNNQEDIKQLGSDVSGFVRLAMDRFKTLISYLKENQYLWEGLKASTGGILGGLALGAGRQFNVQNPPTTPPESEEARQKRLATMEREMEEESRLREQLETRRLNALKETGRLEISTQRKLYQQRYNELLEAYQKERITKEEFQKEDIASWSRTTAIIIGALQRQRTIDLSNEELTAEEKYNINLKYENDVAELWAIAEEGERKRAAAIEAMDKIHAQRRIADANYSYKRISEIANDTLQKNILQEQIYYEQGKKSAIQSANAITEYRKSALDEQIKQIDALIETLGQEKEAENQVKELQLERGKLVRQRDMLTPLEQELEKVIRLKQEKQELLDLDKALTEATFELQQQRIQGRIEDIQNTISKGVSYKVEKELLQELDQLRRQSAQITLDRRLKELEDEKKAALERIKGKENEEEQKFKIEKLYQERRTIAEEEFQRRLKEIRNQSAATTSTAGGGFFDSFRKFLEEGKAKVADFGNVMNEFGGIVLKSFASIGDQLAATLEQWILYGETGPAVMKKILATTLATMAKEMAIKAMYYTALGFGLLAVKDFSGAKDAFKAAALFGGGAAAAAIAGRAIAGDTFKKESGRDSVSGRNTSSTGQVQSGKAYSSMQEQKVDMSRSASFGAVQRETVLVVKDKSGMFSKMFQVELEKNSKVRTSLRTA